MPRAPSPPHPHSVHVGLLSGDICRGVCHATAIPYMLTLYTFIHALTSVVGSGNVRPKGRSSSRKPSTARLRRDSRPRGVTPTWAWPTSRQFRRRRRRLERPSSGASGPPLLHHTGRRTGPQMALLKQLPFVVLPLEMLHLVAHPTLHELGERRGLAGIIRVQEDRIARVNQFTGKVADRWIFRSLPPSTTSPAASPHELDVASISGGDAAALRTSGRASPGEGMPPKAGGRDWLPLHSLMPTRAAGIPELNTGAPSEPGTPPPPTRPPPLRPPASRGGVAMPPVETGSWEVAGGKCPQCVALPLAWNPSPRPAGLY